MRLIFRKAFAFSLAASIGLFLSGSSAGAYYGYCSEPSAPSFYARKPTKPYCAANRNCSKFDVDSYNSEVDRYFRQLKQYASDVDRYYNGASAYLKCMSELD